MIDVKISDTPLEIEKAIRSVNDPTSGGINVFIGTVRDHTKGRKVLRLEFESYADMALSEMQKIADKAASKWPVHDVLIHHRVGVLEVGEVAVIIIVSAAHRDAAFQACRYTIDTLKNTVPIWKKEIFEDGEEWVAAHP